jgi:hypothetical protein
MPSKQVVDRGRSAAAVTAAADTHATQAASALSARLMPHLRSGEKLPDLALLFQLLGREITTRAGEMTAADKAHEDELRDDAPPRHARDESAAELRHSLVGLREVAIGLYGSAVLESLGLSGHTPQDPALLSSYASTVIGALAKVHLPRSRVRGGQLHTAEVTGALTTERDQLEAHLKDVAREAREAEATQVAKDQAIARYDRSFSDQAGLLSALLRAAHLDELADRVRPSARRPGQTIADGESATPAAASGGAPGIGNTPT